MSVSCVTDIYRLVTPPYVTVPPVQTCGLVLLVWVAVQAMHQVRGALRVSSGNS